ncbi:MAG TPA: hypothetical protein VK361_00425 [Rubrobacteraceae bacterium]|nr:hypothetical protein [Rubrobacteraceae bacterium]
MEQYPAAAVITGLFNVEARVVVVVARTASYVVAVALLFYALQIVK